MRLQASPPSPSRLAKAIQSGLNGSEKGFSLFEIILVAGGVSLLATGGFMVYQNASNSDAVKTEQANVQSIARSASATYGSLGSYTGLTTQASIANEIVPPSMVDGSALLSKWNSGVQVEPAAILGRPNTGLRISYQSVPARACAKFVTAASEGMYDIEVDGQSVFSKVPLPGSHGGFRPVELDRNLTITRCREGGSVAFIYGTGVSGLAGNILPPVNLPDVSPPGAPPPPSPPPAPPPVAPPVAPPAPGCGAAPGTPATGTTPAGQVCSFIWASTSAPTCWTSQALCAPVSAPPPSTPPPSAPPPPTYTPPPGGTLCSAPASTTETGNQTGSCPGGTLTPGGSPSFPQTRTRQTTWACPDPFGAPVSTVAPWSAWTPPASSACAPACVIPSPSSETGQENQTATQTLACPSGQSGAITQTRPEQRTRTRSASCPAPTGSAAWTPWGAWGAWTSAGAWTTTSNTCATNCVAPPASSTPITRALSAETRNICPAGWTGSAPESRTRSENGTRTTSWTCPAPTGAATSSTSDAWLGTINYGGWAPSGPNTCAPPVAPPPPPPPADSCPSKPIPSMSAGELSAGAPYYCQFNFLTHFSNSVSTVSQAPGVGIYACNGPSFDRASNIPAGQPVYQCFTHVTASGITCSYSSSSQCRGGSTPPPTCQSVYAHADANGLMFYQFGAPGTKAPGKPGDPTTWTSNAGSCVVSYATAWMALFPMTIGAEVYWLNTGTGF